MKDQALKLHIFSDGEPTRTNVHPKVFEADPEPCSRELLDSSLAALSAALGSPEGQRQSEILSELLKLVPTYTPSTLGLGRYTEGFHGRRKGGTHPSLQPFVKADLFERDLLHVSSVGILGGSQQLAFTPVFRRGQISNSSELRHHGRVPRPRGL